MNKPIHAHDFAHGSDKLPLAAILQRAAEHVPPLWPLESPIAVNPLAAFERLPFLAGVKEAAALFGARQSLPLRAWRRLAECGRINPARLRAIAVEFLGGPEEAFALIGPNVSRLDLLMARLLELDEPDRPGHARDDAAALVAKYCAAFFAPSGAQIQGRARGLYRAVLPLLACDPEFRAIAAREVKALCSDAPLDPLEAIASNLQALGRAGDAALPFLAGLVCRLPGWTGHVRWRIEHAEPELVADAPASIADYLALWTLVARAAPERSRSDDHGQRSVVARLAEHFGFAERLDQLSRFGRSALVQVADLGDAELGLLFMAAAEQEYRDTLVDGVRTRPRLPSGVRAKAQLVFCIDVRSEPLRRAIEAQGSYETIGYAGFFGVPMSLRPSEGSAPRRQLPVLLQPACEFNVTATANDKNGAATRIARSTFNELKGSLPTSFATADAGGLPAAAIMAARTLFPVLAGRLGGAAASEAQAPAPAETAMSLDQRVECAKALFDLTGLGAQTARLVLFVGHGGQAINNPYAGALDCGACGGHRGGPNARVLADILNCRAVREELTLRGLDIPADTLFLAAEHNTTTDVVTILDPHLVPPSHRAELGALMDDLAAAGAAARGERSRKLGCSPSDTFVRAAHWAEVRPEWGLAGNAAFIVGPRALTMHMDLEGRAFLHSYDWRTDDDGRALEVILTAPLIVAQWINCQYLFSTIDNERYGAGDKTTHNVLGGIGVVQGNGNALRVGLPRQSLFDDEGLPYHVPQRLLAVVEAPLERIEAIVDRHVLLRHLFDHGWVHLVALDPVTGTAKRWRTDQPVHADRAVAEKADTSRAELELA